MPITADRALSNKILIGKRQAKPLYTFTNKQLALGSIKGTFNSNIISNELPIDTFSFNVNYDDEANQVYLTSDTNKAYVCAGYVPGTLEQRAFPWNNNISSAVITGNTITVPDSPSRECNFEFWRPRYEPNPSEYWFRSGDVLRIGITVERTQNSETWVLIENGNILSAQPVTQYETKTGVFFGTNNYVSTKNTGHDIITINFLGNVRSIELNTRYLTPPYDETGATVQITGIEFNGKMYFGSLYRSDLPRDQLPALYILSNRDKTPAAEYLKDVKYGTPVWWYCNGKFMMKGYYQGNTRIARTIWQINAMSAIGKLDEKIHVGGIYTGDTFEDVLNEITGNTCRYEFDASSEPLRNAQIFGWLPYDTARNNLHRLLFAMGAAIKRKGST